jgi:hypothetical protein
MYVVLIFCHAISLLASTGVCYFKASLFCLLVLNTCLFKVLVLRFVMNDYCLDLDFEM